MNEYKEGVPFCQSKLAAEEPIDKTTIVENIQSNQFERKWKPIYRKPENLYAKQIEKLSRQKKLNFNFEIDDNNN